MNSLPLEYKNQNTSRSGRPYRVMLVDDSAVIRGLLARWLSEDAAIEIVGSVANGQAALNAIDRCDPEIIVLDIEMPVMDGLTALPRLLKAKPNVQILMSSTLTSKNAQTSLRAMSLGAADYIAKPTTNREVITSQSFQEDLIEKVKVLAEAKRKQLGLAAYDKTRNSISRRQNLGSAPPKVVKLPVTVKKSDVKPEIIVIGSSTGGPQALLKLIGDLKNDLSLPLLITQHMPATFTKILAGHLSKATGLNCMEGADGMRLVGGEVYIAPGDHHMTVEKKGGINYLRLNQNPPENFCRPAVDPMFRSVSAAYGPAVLGIVLTGMGHDGLAGSRTIVEAGGTVIAQNEETSVVWGMPGAVIEAGISNSVLPLDEMAAKVTRLARGMS